MDPISYPQPQHGLMGKAKETELGGLSLSLGRYLKAKREPTQLFFPGWGEGKLHQLEPRPLSAPAVR